MIIVQMHIVNFQRDLVVGWIIHIELKVHLLSRVFKAAPLQAWSGSEGS